MPRHDCNTPRLTTKAHRRLLALRSTPTSSTTTGSSAWWLKPNDRRNRWFIYSAQTVIIERNHHDHR